MMDAAKTNQMSRRANSLLLSPNGIEWKEK